jgi:glycosyltransferase involved in cell wall biosynthesis
MVLKNSPFERLLREAASRLTHESDAKLPGFDARRYLEFNPDIANHCNSTSDPKAAAKAHYLRYGMQEMRRVFPGGAGLKDPESRILSEIIHASADQAGWLQAAKLVAAARKQSLSELVDSHPRHSWLNAGFNYPSYATSCLSILKESFDKDAITLHFLEFGLEEGATGYPELWDPKTVKVLYGTEISTSLNGPEALRELRKAKGSTPVAMNETELFVLNGMSPTLADLFEADYSHSMAQAAGKSLSRVQIIAEFCQTGWKSLQPIHPDLQFDPAFYEDTYNPLSMLPSGLSRDAALYQHWLSFGALEKRAPNLAKLGSSIFGVDVPLSILNQLNKFVLGSVALDVNSTPTEILQHMLLTPNPGLEWVDLSDPLSQSFVRNFGDKSVVDDDLELGQWLYSLVLAANPDHVKANVALADLLQKESNNPLVRTLRQKVPVSQENGWNSLKLSELFLDQGRFGDAAGLLEQSAPHVEADVVKRTQHAKLAARGFHDIWNKVADRAEIFGVEHTQNELRKMTRAYASQDSHHFADRSTPITSVALVGNEDLFQCKLYRIDQKAEQLREAGFDVRIYSASDDLELFVNSLDQFQAVIFFRVPAFPQVMDVIIRAGQAGLATFYEIDDIVFDTEHFPPSFESYANQITRREYNAMACGVPLFERAMELCEYGIASTATLREIMETKVRSGRVFEHQNALGRLHLLAMADNATRTRKNDGRIVIFYGSGTKAHKEDFHEILEPALATIAQKHGRKIEIRLIGHFDAFKYLDTKRHNVKLLQPVWDFEEYCTLLADADINLSVLSPSILTDAKSEIKWMEAAMFGTPSVVSATRTHREKITQRKTGILCETTDDFTEALDALIQDETYREAIGQAAYEKVVHDYSLHSMGQNLRNIFEAVRHPTVHKKRIAIVNVFYPPQAIGGATRVVHDNVRILREKYGSEYEIDVICSYEGGKNAYEVSRYARDGVRVWAIATPDRPDIDHQITDKKMEMVFNNILDQVQPDMVHFHCIQRLTTSIIDATRLRQIPYVITMHDAWWISKNQFVLDQFGTESYYDYTVPKSDLPERALKLKRTLFGAEAILPVSHAFGELVKRAGVTKLRVIENGVSDLPQASKMPSENNRVRLAHIGGVSRHKGYHHVRNALLTEDFQNLELLVIDHALSPDMEIKETWGNTPVIRRGKFSQNEVSKLYANIDVLLAPSTWPESYGLVAREALASGAWVVASDQGAIGSDVVEGENGFIVDVSTHAGVQTVFRAIDADPQRYRHPPQVIHALRHVEAQVAELDALYREITTAKP